MFIDQNELDEHIDQQMRDYVAQASYAYEREENDGTVNPNGANVGGIMLQCWNEDICPVAVGKCLAMLERAVTDEEMEEGWKPTLQDVLDNY